MGKHTARIATICAILVIAPASVAAAYVIPTIPKGKPGGPPTTPKGGKSSSKNPTKKVGKKIAGFTGSELAKKGSVTVTVRFPSAGTIGCQLQAGGTLLGSGKTTAKKATSKPLKVTFTSTGKAYLNAHNGQAIVVKISCSFNPKKKGKKTSKSTSTVTLYP